MSWVLSKKETTPETAALRNRLRATWTVMALDKQVPQPRDLSSSSMARWPESRCDGRHSGFLQQGSVAIPATFFLLKRWVPGSEGAGVQPHPPGPLDLLTVTSLGGDAGASTACSALHLSEAHFTFQ